MAPVHTPTTERNTPRSKRSHKASLTKASAHPTRPLAVVGASLTHARKAATVADCGRDPDEQELDLDWVPHDGHSSGDDDTSDDESGDDRSVGDSGGSTLKPVVDGEEPPPSDEDDAIWDSELETEEEDSDAWSVQSDDSQ